MKFVDRLGEVVFGAKAPWIGPIQFFRHSVVGPTIRVMTSSAVCDSCGGPLRPTGGVVKFCSSPCRHARHQTAKVRLHPWAVKKLP